MRARIAPVPGEQFTPLSLDWLTDLADLRREPEAEAGPAWPAWPADEDEDEWQTL